MPALLPDPEVGPVGKVSKLAADIAHEDKEGNYIKAKVLHIANIPCRRLEVIGALCLGHWSFAALFSSFGALHGTVG